MYRARRRAILDRRRGRSSLATLLDDIGILLLRLSALLLPLCIAGLAAALVALHL